MSARDVSPFVGWHCSGVFCHVRCAEPCAWCSDEATKNEAALAAAGLVVVPREPTEAMAATSARAVWGDCWNEVDDDTQAETMKDCAFIYRAMIAAAMQEATNDPK